MIVLSDKQKQLMDELKKNNSESYYHCLRVKNISNKMIIVMNNDNATSYSASEIDYICKGALLHDIGKLYVSNFTLTKEIKLNEDERDEILQHTKNGYDAIKDELGDEEREIVGNICLYHHERIDGGGYYGMSDIPLYVQIVALCDVYDALSSDRIYRGAFSPEKSISIIEKGESGKFDKALIQYLKKVICESDEI